VSVTRPAGFSGAGVAAGIKASGQPDLALVCSEDGVPVPAAGVFTSNRAAAAPVQVSRFHLAATGGRAAAVVLSSGNANAATGPQGVRDATVMCERVADGIGAATEDVLVAQTGLIGIPLPIEPILGRIPALVEARSADEDGGRAAARAIMTTDTVRKEVVVEGPGFTVGGMAKGAAMLAPSMATMLAVLTTDARIEPGELYQALLAAVADSFNALTVDGCTSTNDSVIVLANGRSGTVAPPAAVTDALSRACADLAGQMAADAEGASKVVHVVVTGAAADADAHRAARRVADSPLVKCSMNGEDPYWGRVVSELGSAGVAFELDRTDVAYGNVTVCRGGVAADHDAEAVAAYLAGRSIELRCHLGLGSGRAAVLTTDLGHGYIDENRTTS
jgi:glutamate N-acetyltransferase / amino-acid N-acetyltransferase